MPSELHRLIVDGANVMGSRPDGWWADRPAAARRLAGELQPLATSGATIVLVLEGKAKAGVPAGDGDGDGAVTVVHAPADGDGTIVDLVTRKERPGDWTVVTADRALAERVRNAGARVVGPNTLWRALGR